MQVLQFQHSLQGLLVALNMAIPFFVNCLKQIQGITSVTLISIKSSRNVETFEKQGPNQLEEEIVLRQLGSTCVLETVCIR